jgi:hypothetical protein
MFVWPHDNAHLPPCLEIVDGTHSSMMTTPARWRLEVTPPHGDLDGTGA